MYTTIGWKYCATNVEINDIERHRFPESLILLFDSKPLPLLGGITLLPIIIPPISREFVILEENHLLKITKKSLIVRPYQL